MKRLTRALLFAMIFASGLSASSPETLEDMGTPSLDCESRTHVLLSTAGGAIAGFGAFAGLYAFAHNFQLPSVI